MTTTTTAADAGRVLMDAWASTTPWRCDDPQHRHTPLAGQPCAVCGSPLPAGEVCYYVVQLPRGRDGAEQPVCWRHVHPGDGPVRVGAQDR